MDGKYFSNLSFPCPRETPKRNLSNTGPEASEAKSFEILNILPIHMEATLTSP